MNIIRDSNGLITGFKFDEGDDQEAFWKSFTEVSKQREETIRKQCEEATKQYSVYVDLCKGTSKSFFDNINLIK